MLPALASLLPVVAPAVAPILSQVLGGGTQGGGSNPLQSLLGAFGGPLQALFGQATSQLASPFRSIPAAFQSPVTGRIGDLLQAAGDLDGQEKKAFELLQSDKIGDQVAGQQLLNKINRLKDFLFKTEELENNRRSKVIDNLR